MTEEQIKEVMRLGDVIENLAWSAGKTEQYHDEPTDYAEKLPAARAALEAYLRTIGEPENAFPLSPNGASKWAHLQKHDGAKAIGVVFRTGSGSVGSLVDGRVVWADWLAHPESTSECDNEAMQEIDAAIARAESAIESSPKPVTFPAMKAAFRTTRVEAEEFIMAFKFRDIEDMDRADDEWRAAMAIETPAKVSPCAVQQEADEAAKGVAVLQFKCWTCLDTGFLMKPMIAPEPPDVKCPNGCLPKKGGA